MTDIRRGFVDADYGQMHYRISGRASDENTLVCLHQSPKSSREFIDFMKAMGNNRLVIAIDTPGHGESDVPIQKMSIEGYATEIWSALGKLDLGRVDLFGNHTGAKVAAEMAYQQPGNVNKIVMISALILTNAEREDFKSQFTPVPLDEEGTRFKHMWAQAIKYRGEEVSLEQLAFSMAENLRAGEAYEWGHEAAFNYSEVFPERLAKLPHHITVLNPKDMLFELTPRVAEHIHNGEIVDCPQWEFGFLSTDPTNVVKFIKDILA